MHADGLNMDDLKRYLELKGELDELSEQASQRRAEMTLIESRLLEQFALNGLQSMNIDGCCVYHNVEKYANAKKEFRPQLVEWARRTGLDDMIVLQPASFKSWCREQIEQGELPAEIAGMVDIFEKPSLRVRKA